MAEGARLESVYTATYRGFESPPHRHIQERARTKVRAFVSKLLVFTVIFLMKGLFLDLWLLHQTYYRLCKTALLPYLKRFRKVCISISR